MQLWLYLKAVVMLDLGVSHRQRVMIAMALEPALLIADEPTTAHDVTTQMQILRVLREIQSRRGTGVLFITYDFGEVAEIADRVAVMQRGRIVEMGPTAKVFAAAEHAYTRSFWRAFQARLGRRRRAERIPENTYGSVDAVDLLTSGQAGDLFIFG